MRQPLRMFLRWGWVIQSRLRRSRPVPWSSYFLTLPGWHCCLHQLHRCDSEVSRKERRFKSLAAHDQPGPALRPPDLLAKSLLLRSHCPWTVSAQGLVVIAVAWRNSGPQSRAQSWEQALNLFLPYGLSRIVPSSPLSLLSSVCPSVKWEWWHLCPLTPAPHWDQEFWWLPQPITMAPRSPTQCSECREKGHVHPILGVCRQSEGSARLMDSFEMGPGVGCRLPLRILPFLWPHALL